MAEYRRLAGDIICLREGRSEKAKPFDCPDSAPNDTSRAIRIGGA